MTTTAVVTLLLVTGFVWGGFVYFAVLAMRKEKEKIREEGSLERSRS